ncbi:hypothetical protein Tco_1414176 [Tanacetum coccineum]
MKEQANNVIKTKDSRIQRQSNLKKFKKARFKISPQEFEDHTLGEIDHTKIFGPDVRPRPAGKTRPAKKTKSETTGSNGGSASGSISYSVSEDLSRKLQAGTSAYEVKELEITEFKELEFLTIDPDTLAHVKKGSTACVSPFEWLTVIKWSPYQTPQLLTDHSEDDTSTVNLP